MKIIITTLFVHFSVCAFAGPATESSTSFSALTECNTSELSESGPVSLTDFVRRSNGSVWHMEQEDAEKYCKNLGLRLPTPRELALYSQSLGSLGIHETAYPEADANELFVQAEISEMKSKNFNVLFTRNRANKIVVDFYFNNSGYLPPAGDFGNYWFWSSAIIPGYGMSVGYIMYGNTGYIGKYYPTGVHTYLPVRCTYP